MTTSAGVTGLRRLDGAPLRVAMLAPPWLPVPPPGYGGIEVVVGHLTDALVELGHDVTLLAAPGSSSQAKVRTLLPVCHPHEIGSALHDADQVSTAFAVVDAEARTGRPFDVLHDHSGYTAVAMADRVGVPVVSTLHNALTPALADFHRRHAGAARLVAISHSQRRSAPAGVPLTDVVPNPLALRDWPFSPDRRPGAATGDGYLLWVGRMDPAKGPDLAVLAAREAGLPIVLAGPVQEGQPGQREFFDSTIAPLLASDDVQYLGEVAAADKHRLFSGARALLMPLRWDEPFGMVMVEALASGTPVIAYPRGAAPEIVRPGCGFLVADEHEMATAVARLGEIDPAFCRATVERHFSPLAAAAAYVRVYRHAMRRRAPSSLPPRASGDGP
jgi:glycosyltransferase involved in cell wall biosynthesis